MESKILDSVPAMNKFVSFIDRYFTKHYIVDVGGVVKNDIRIMFHSNRIAVITLAPSHFFFDNKSMEYKVNYSIGNVDRLSNSVKGKGKKGGQQLNPKSVICRVEYADGTSFDVPCCMKGTLVEVNEKLVEHPELLKKLPETNGYIAIVISSITKSETTKEGLLTDYEYLRHINSCDTQ